MNSVAVKKNCGIPSLWIVLCLLFAIFGLVPGTQAGQRDGKEPATGRNGMVGSAHPLATQAGLEILKRGGNAVDAAVATAFALGMVEPYASGLGGGGFLLIYNAKTGKLKAIDYRETAPAKTPRDIKQSERSAGPLSVAVPGTVAGLSMALSDYGTMKFSEVLEPAIKLGETGFPAGSLLINMIDNNREKLSGNPEAQGLYLNPGYSQGGVVYQKDLAGTYRKLASGGPGIFYKGQIADAIAKEVGRLGGVLTSKDLADYRAIVREPVKGTYKGHEIYCMPPPSSGGVHVIEMLNILDGFDFKGPGLNSARTMQIMSEAMRRVFRDRTRFMGDPDFVEIPVKGLVSRKYAAELAKTIYAKGLNRRIVMPDPSGFESTQTSHISTADKDGNLVALTQTINSFFGSGIVVPGTGIILNNEMKDFGGWKANEPAPGKKPVSNMSPTIVLKMGKPYMSVGMAGATRIISVLPQIIINIVDFGMDIQAAIDAPRFHCMSDVISMEDRISRKTSEELSAMGYGIERRGAFDIYFGGAQGVLLDSLKGTIYGGADPRRDGSARGY